MLNIVKRAIDPYMIHAYPNVPDFAASSTPSHELQAHLDRIDYVREHNARAIRLQGRAIYWFVFGVGLLFLVVILIASRG